ncbi:hypothetical protein CCACVL1_08926 [Corchorus capsularis]|uniref:CBS domain-containing protein n=1 Tax=Corchorus capsularis TaxID=210143 RepID=A0A1R3IYF0_COCAP|nr:hypothetical protein CCACVL1_08926 [Corchorus capsularis]
MEMQEKGLENITVADVLMTKGEENVGSWFWCRINDNVDDAMKNVDNHIRHVPVIDGRMVGMVSIVDIVKAVVEQQNGELKRLNEFIKGEYY